MVCYGRPPRRSGRRGEWPSVGAVTTVEGVFVWKGATHNIPQKGQFVKRGRTGILPPVYRSPHSSAFPLLCALLPATCDLLSVTFLHHLLHTPRIRMQVAGRGGQIGVPQHHLQRRRAAPGLQKARGKRLLLCRPHHRNPVAHLGPNPGCPQRCRTTAKRRPGVLPLVVR